MTARVPGVRRHVGSALTANFVVPSTIAVQIAVATTAGDDLSEHLDVTWGDNSEPVGVADVIPSNDGRVHIIEAPAGQVSINYSASITSPTPGVDVPPDVASWRYDDEVLTALRQSRYCPSDVLAPFAVAELGDIADRNQVVAAVVDWVFGRIDYGYGSSGPADSAIDTLLAGRGVCRDFAHLAITLLRALGVPARFVSVYAPGLGPMDFHAVVEVWQSGRWEIVDPTRLAPRPALVRIATGRDAADTAFVMTLAGHVDLVASEVFAVIDGDLPLDDHLGTVALA